MDAFAAALTSYSRHAKKDRELSQFKELIGKKFSSFLASQDLDPYRPSERGDAAQISKLLIQLPFNFYLGPFFRSGNPGSGFDPQIDPNTGAEFKYVTLLRQLEKMMDVEKIPAKGEDEEWKVYFSTLTALINQIEDAWKRECKDGIYFNPNDWITNEFGFVKKRQDLVYLKKEDIVKLKSGVGQVDAEEIKEAIKTTIEEFDGKNTVVTTQDGTEISIDVGNPEVFARHIVNRHTFFGTMERKVINTYFHKYKEDFNIGNFRDHFHETIRTLKSKLEERITKDTVSSEQGEIEFNEDFGDIGIEGTLSIEDVDEHNTPTKYKIVLKSIYPNGAGYLGEG